LVVNCQLTPWFQTCFLIKKNNFFLLQICSRFWFDFYSLESEPTNGSNLPKWVTARHWNFPYLHKFVLGSHLFMDFPMSFIHGCKLLKLFVTMQFVLKSYKLPYIPLNGETNGPFLHVFWSFSNVYGLSHNMPYM
jgi:hypothetical protein